LSGKTNADLFNERHHVLDLLLDICVAERHFVASKRAEKTENEVI
jgi:hypothetical protein